MSDIFTDIAAYEKAVKDELKALGATPWDFTLVSQELIWNNFTRRRNPRDVAWAILQ